MNWRSVDLGPPALNFSIECFQKWSFKLHTTSETTSMGTGMGKTTIKTTVAAGRWWVMANGLGEVRIRTPKKQTRLARIQNAQHSASGILTNLQSHQLLICRYENQSVLDLFLAMIWDYDPIIRDSGAESAWVNIRYQYPSWSSSQKHEINMPTYFLKHCLFPLSRTTSTGSWRLISWLSPDAISWRLSYEDPQSILISMRIHVR